MISGEPAMAGSILEVSDSVAVTLLNLGKAVVFKEAATEPDVEVTAPAEPSQEEAPKPKTTRKRTKQ